MNLFDDRSLDAAREARRDRIADVRLDDLTEGGELHRQIVSAMLDAAIAALDTAQLVDIAARALADESRTRLATHGVNWSDLSEGLRNYYRRQARTSLVAVGLLERGPDGPS
jgi:pyruvate dehydrogenase complex dehydrogenase (E1) component